MIGFKIYDKYFLYFFFFKDFTSEKGDYLERMHIFSLFISVVTAFAV